MQNPLKMLGDLNSMRKQAAQIQKMLEAEEYIIEEGTIKIVITGSQTIKKVEIDGVEDRQLADAINKAIKKSQQAAAGKLAQMSQMMEN